MDYKFRQNFIQQTVLGGVFYDAVRNRQSGQTKKEALQMAATGFEPFTKKDFETRFGDTYQTAEWLAKNKTTLTPGTIYEKLKNSRPLTCENITALWDNLYYYIILNLPSRDKNIINNMLVIQHILTNIKTHNKIDYIRLSNAILLIPDEIFTEDR